MWSAPLLLLLAIFLHCSNALLVGNLKSRSSLFSLPVRKASTTTFEDETRLAVKDQLLQLISTTPSNAPTSKQTTKDILAVVRELEALCPTPDGEVVQKLGGNWELLWTAQDQSSDEWGMGPLRRWIK
jgi:hypothetical protein